MVYEETDGLIKSCKILGADMVGIGYPDDRISVNTNWKFILYTGWADLEGADVVKDIAKFADRLKYVYLKDFRAKKTAEETNGSRNKKKLPLT